MTHKILVHRGPLGEVVASGTHLEEGPQYAIEGVLGRSHPFVLKSQMDALSRSCPRSMRACRLSILRMVGR